jgi:hypothetical protein
MGKVRTTLKKNHTKGKKQLVLCATRKRETNHLVLQSVDTSGEEVVGYTDNIEETIDWTNNYQIIQCQGCDTISFRRVSWFSEAVDYDSDGASEQLYPKRAANTLSTREFLNLPYNLRRIYREVIDCFNEECNTLCAASLRAIVEGLCADQGISDGPVVVKKGGRDVFVRKNHLQAKIAGLHEKGILT